VSDERKPPRQAYRFDEPHRDELGMASCAVFFVVAVLIGGIAMYLLLRAVNLI
jgi:hypothetical protein